MEATLVIGASPKPYRYSYRAIQMLREAGHRVYAYGLKSAQVADVLITSRKEDIPPAEIDTVTLYLGPQNQAGLDVWLEEIHPRRVIFNPGTENPQLAHYLKGLGIQPVEACTLVMLGTRQY